MQIRNLWYVGMCFILCCIYGQSIAQPHKVKVACIGNSVTYGYKLPDPSTQSYPALIQQMLGEKYEVKNFGHSGATLLRKGHNPYFKTKEFKEALQFNADVAIIHLGLNDTDPRNWNNYRNEFKSDYAWLIDTLRKSNSKIAIYICLLTPIFNDHPRFRSGTREWFWEIQNTIPSIAQANHTGLIDLHTPLYFHPNLFPDALHPDKEGAAILAKTVYSSITGDYGGLQVSRVFQDNMVLQRNVPVPFFGTANTNETVTVSFNGKSKKGNADANGKWKIFFDALPAGGPFTANIKTGNKEIRLSNILMGDVWLCAGQSNMAFPLQQSSETKSVQKEMVNSNLRLFAMNAVAETDNVAWDTATLRAVNQLQYFSGRWQNSDATTAPAFSAVAWYFGNKIQQDQNIPVGLIQVAVGGAPIVSFMERHSMEFDNYLLDELYDWKKSDFLMPWVRERASKNLELSNDARQRHPYEPCYIYEAGISQFISTPVTGILWYQGESDAHSIELYDYNFRHLISQWRELWKRNLPVYFVQLSAIDRPSWPYFRDMQRQISLTVSNVYMAVSSDLGDSLNVHPRQKKPVGERLAKLALKYSYHKNIVAEGPSVKSAVQQGNMIRISFAHSKKLQTRNHEKLTGFQVQNEKGESFTPRAEIKNNTVLLYLNTNENIVKVLYAYLPFTRANLENEANLPAGTFSFLMAPTNFKTSPDSSQKN